MRRDARLIAIAALCAWPMRPAGASQQPQAYTDAIEIAQNRVVKIYGGALGRERGYASGIVVSPDGWIVTAASAVLETGNPRVVLPDGRRFPAEVLARDPRRQLALLTIDARDLEPFALESSDHVTAGDWVVCAANPFKVADGAEPVSIMVGVVAGRAPLAARRRARDFAFDGTVLLLDVIVATPGSAGGAVVDLDGRLVGIVGRAVQSTRTNTWANYALPVEEVAAFVEAAREGKSLEPPPPQLAGAVGVQLADLGIRLFDVGGRYPPPYVERVTPESPAAGAGLHANDLVVSVNGQAVSTCAEVRDAIAAGIPGAQLELLVKRGDDVELVLIETE